MRTTVRHSLATGITEGVAHPPSATNNVKASSFLKSVITSLSR